MLLLLIIVIRLLVFTLSFIAFDGNDEYNFIFIYYHNLLIIII